MKLAKIIFGFYFCAVLPAASFSKIHYDHSLAEGHESHICFEQGVDCDCKTTAHSEESLWEHVFEAGCIKDVIVQTLDSVVFNTIFQIDLRHTPSGLEYAIIPFHEVLIGHRSDHSDQSRAPPLFN